MGSRDEPQEPFVGVVLASLLLPSCREKKAWAPLQPPSHSYITVPSPSPCCFVPGTL